MKKIIPFVSLFFIISSLFLFYSFRQTPKGELWKGYSVLYVSNDVPDEEITDALVQFGITNFTCLSNQYMPTVLDSSSVEISLLEFNPNALDYLARRNNYFFDKSYDYRLYYVPIEYSAKLSSCVSYLNKNKIFSGVDSTTTYPILLPVLVFAFTIVLLIFAKNKLLFASMSVLSVLYSICFPYLSCAVSSILLTLVLFATSNLYKRRGAVKLILKNVIFSILILVSIVSSFTATFTSGFMFVLLSLSSFSAYFLYDAIYENNQKKYSFNPVPIRSARFIPIFSKKENVIFPVSIVAVLAIFVVSVFSVDAFSVSDSTVQLPSSAAAIKSENLPELEEYARWDFIVKSYPYISINSKNDFTDSVSFYRYSTSGREIIETLETLTFDNDFIENTISQIDSLNFNAVEKILKEQPSNFVYGYSVTGSQSLSLFSIILVIAQIICLSFFYIKIVMKKSRGNK